MLKVDCGVLVTLTNEDAEPGQPVASVATNVYVVETLGIATVVSLVTDDKAVEGVQE